MGNLKIHWFYVLLMCHYIILCIGQRISNNCQSFTELTKSCNCVDKREGLDINCQNLTGQVVQNTLQHLRTLNHNISYLKLRHMVLLTIPKGFFHGLKVKHLTIVYSNLTSVDPQAFDQEGFGRHLETLDMSHNQLSEVPSAALKVLKELSYLNLNNNNFSTIRSGALEGMQNLLRLLLNMNYITKMDTQAFDGASKKLTRINLSKNLLQKVPVDAVKQLSDLEQLELHENLISSVAKDDFQGLKRVDTLNLASNQLTEIKEETFMHLKTLNWLDLSSNRIESIHKNAFSGIEDKLEWLRLGDNRLNMFPSEPLRKLSKLKEINLYSNNIVTIPDDAFDKFASQLKQIDLHNNSISHIPTSAFDRLYHLTWLNLYENKLTRLPQETYEMFLGRSDGNVVNLHDNPFDCDCHMTWFYRWSLNDKGKKVLKSPEKVRCHRPKLLENRALHSLHLEQLTCPMVVATSAAHRALSIGFYTSISLLSVLLFF